MVTYPKVGVPPQYEPEKVAAALLEAKGLVTFAAKKLRCNPSTVYDYINKYPVVRQARDDARNAMGDAAESRLYRNVNKGDQRAVEFYLKTIHKGRGYVERQELAGVAEHPIVVNINRIESRPTESEETQ